ncbi:MAG: C1 family peptidase, partial [Bacteroidales bacterium]|nr:C1 family peptidase [Bacteroidales bacterium]
FNAILDEYLGPVPEKLAHKGKEYSPGTFYSNATGLNMDDYVSLTSFTHHPFYTTFPIEVPDNWIGEVSYNIPLEELMNVMDKAIDNGYTFAWGADVSEIGFVRRGSIAIVPDFDNVEMADAEIAKWTSMPQSQKMAEFLKNPGKEKVITQEMRQLAFDNYETTDDHGLHVIGKATDQNGNKYFIVKNSWGEYGDYKGYLYASYNYVAYKTLNILIHKDALPKDLKKKLGL